MPNQREAVKGCADFSNMINSVSCSSLLALREGDWEFLGWDQCFRGRVQPRDVSAASAPEETHIPPQEEQQGWGWDSRDSAPKSPRKNPLLLRSGVDPPGCFSSRVTPSPRAGSPGRIVRVRLSAADHGCSVCFSSG